MRSRSRIGWRLTLATVPVLLVVLAALALFGRLSDERHALASAREEARRSSRALLGRVDERMMAGDTEGVRRMVADVAVSTPGYAALQLSLHPGEARAVGATPEGEQQDDWPCAVCHLSPDPAAGLGQGQHDAVREVGDGTRVLSVVTPILGTPGCRTAACHAQAGPVLGLLRADLSLRDVDACIAARTRQTLWACAIAAAVLAVLIALLVHRFLHQPMRELALGMKRVGQDEAGLRLSMEGRGEFEELAHAFNAMADRLERAFAELRDTRDYLEGIIESSADLIVAVNPKGYVYTFNQGAEAMLGYGRSEVIGRSVEKLFSDPTERARAVKRLRGKDNVVNYETRLVTKDGDTRNVMLTLSRLRTPDGKALGAFGIGKDLTDQKRLQERLVQSERLAAMGQAVAGIQHALKNMLNALKGGSYIVGVGLEKDDRALVDEGWSMVCRGIDKLTSMSGHMLGYVRETRPSLESVDLGRMVREIETVARPTAEDAGVELDVDAPEHTPAVQCDPRLIHSVVMDLLSNALDACRDFEYEDGERPRVRVRVQSAVAQIVISVADNGCGMSPAVRDRIFDPFFSTKRGLGTGLGLALTARTIRLHGGGVEVESEENHGSEFRIMLPVDGPARGKEVSDDEEGARGG